MNKFLKLIRRLGRLLPSRIGSARPYPVILPPSPASPRQRGRVLFSYLEYPLLWPENAPKFDGHTNLWESREIARIFQELGYQVEAINWSDDQYIPSGSYEVVFDIFTNLGRLAPYMDAHTIKILHCTGSDPSYQNAAELRRVEAANKRRNGRYTPKRTLKHTELNYLSIQVADACSLLGNVHTLNTYPTYMRNKTERVTVSASPLGNTLKKPDQYVTKERQFLWFFGGGAIHKGLDLLLDVFAQHPDMILNVVGDVQIEKDFMEMYQRELLHMPNIRYHGYLIPRSARFQRISQGSFCFIAPTCSEGISSAVVTCMQIGLYPIISRDTGIDLPDGCGTYLEDCSLKEIEKAIISAYNQSAEELSRQISITQEYALRNFSREVFREKMTLFITSALNQHEAKYWQNKTACT